MVLNNSQFKTLIENLPSIEVFLEWEHEEGKANIEGHEMTSDIFLLYADFNVYETGTIDSGDRPTEPSFNSNGINIEDISVDIFVEESGEQINLTKEQNQAIIKAIESKISTS